MYLTYYVHLVGIIIRNWFVSLLMGQTLVNISVQLHPRPILKLRGILIKWFVKTWSHLLHLTHIYGGIRKYLGWLQGMVETCDALHNKMGCRRIRSEWLSICSLVYLCIETSRRTLTYGHGTCCIPAHQDPEGTFWGIFILLDSLLYLSLVLDPYLVPCLYLHTVSLALCHAPVWLLV
jgi:hypothetical protein